MRALQAYRSVCIPQSDRLDMPIPHEYVGREVEIIVLPLWDGSVHGYNAETLAAMQETLDVMDGKINIKSYDTVEDMNADIDTEEAD